MSALVQSGENRREELAKGTRYVHHPKTRQGSLYSALPDLRAAQTSIQARQAKVTPRPLLAAARARPMCDPKEFRAP